jgi:hypothetical protein
MPAELMLAAIPMLANARAELSDFLDQLLSREVFKIFVHPERCVDAPAKQVAVKSAWPAQGPRA